MDKVKIAKELMKIAKEIIAVRRTVEIDWNDIKSIKEAERLKTRLENAGFTLIKTIGGLTTSELIYEKDNRRIQHEMEKDEKDRFDKIAEKTMKDIEKLERKFPHIDGIKVLSEWSGRTKDVNSIFLGDAAEGGEIDGMPAADYNSWEYDPDEKTYIMNVHKKLRKELEKLGYGLIEWNDPGTLMAYKD